MRTLISTLLLLTVACGKDDDRIEGQLAGDCIDGADNDLDGAFDCADPGCAGSPDCGGTPGGLPTGLPTGLTTGTPSGSGTGTGTGTGSSTTTATQFSVSLTWNDDGTYPYDSDGDGLPDGGCGDSLEIQIADPQARSSWLFGMAEDGASGWTGEDCYNGFAQYNYCHPISRNHTLDQVSGCLPDGIIEGQSTLFSAGADPFITYYLEPAGGGCVTWGAWPSYYASLGCSPLP